MSRTIRARGDEFSDEYWASFCPVYRVKGDMYSNSWCFGKRIKPYAIRVHRNKNDIKIKNILNGSLDPDNTIFYSPKTVSNIFFFE